MHKIEKINYLEIPARDLKKTKDFFIKVFDFKFTDFGDEYTTFSNEAGLDGGFFKANLASSPKNGAALVVFFSHDIYSSKDKITKHGGQIVQDIFDFPGGRRFHFTEPSGNEFAVWALPETKL